MQYDVFISYSRRDAEKVQPLVAYLKTQWRVFLDTESMRVGDEFPPELEQAARVSRCLLVFWSSTSVRSPWVFREAMIGKEQDTLVPVLLEMISENSIPREFRTINAAVLYDWDGVTQVHRSFTKLIQAIAEKVGESEVWEFSPDQLSRVLIPDGKFMMGSSEESLTKVPDSVRTRALLRETPQREVQVADFHLATTPVLVYQYRRFLLDIDNPSQRKPQEWEDENFRHPHKPVVGISWEDAVSFCSWAGGRLPTEIEWEYACRAGTSSLWYTGDNPDDVINVAWFETNSKGVLQIAGQKNPNSFGLYDMHGNVWEWCQNKFDDQDGNTIRGGCYLNPVYLLRSAQRMWLRPGQRRPTIGFRVAW